MDHKRDYQESDTKYEFDTIKEADEKLLFCVPVVLFLL